MRLTRTRAAFALMRVLPARTSPDLPRLRPTVPNRSVGDWSRYLGINELSEHGRRWCRQHAADAVCGCRGAVVVTSCHTNHPLRDSALRGVLVLFGIPRSARLAASPKPGAPRLTGPALSAWLPQSQTRLRIHGLERAVAESKQIRAQFRKCSRGLGPESPGERANIPVAASLTPCGGRAATSTCRRPR